MEELIEGLRQAVEARIWYPALSLALALPDIGAEAEFPAEKSYERRYARWWDENVGSFYQGEVGHPAEKITFLTGRDAYALRSAFLHEGRGNVRTRIAIEKFHFIEPTADWRGSHRGLIDKKHLVLRVDRYCLDVATAAERWIDQRRGEKKTTEPTRMLRVTRGVRIGDYYIT